MKKLTKEKFTYTPAVKKKDAIPLWFCFPSTYAVGMSGLGYLSLFKILDRNENVYPERIFTDTEKPVHNAKKVELMGFAVSFELDFLGIFKILEKYNIPLKSKDRGNECPVIFGGGPVLTANPEPYADFFDVILIGEGEEALTELIDAYNEVRHLKNKRDKLLHLAKIEGLYIPSLYDVEYNPDDTIKSFEGNHPEAPEKIKRRCAESLKNSIYSPIITEKSMFSNMFLIEVARGCPRRCRFCIASYLYLPARYPDYESITQAIDTGLNYTNKIGLLGALIADHPDFDKICEYILQKRKEKDFEVSVSSLRADKITPLIVKMLVECHQRQATIAIEAGSDRLREFINKHLSEKAIIENVKNAAVYGLSGLKIYGIIGIPTETQQDIDELVSLLAKLKKENKAFKLTLSISSFVPKAQTPFQWARREDGRILQEKSDYLRKELAQNKILFKPTSIKWDYIQAILSRGDRRLAPLIEQVYKNGGTIGSWNKSYKDLKEEKIHYIPSFDWYAVRERPYDETLPWYFIDIGFDKQVLQAEREKAYT